MELTVIILSFNTKDLTLRAVKSVIEEVSRVIVVDNHSSDGSIEALKRLSQIHKNLTVELLNENVGFAAGNNVALRQVKTKYFMLLNSDAYVEPNQNIDSIISYLETHADVGIVSPKVLLSNNHIDPACHRGFPTPWNALSYYSGLERLTKHSRLFGGYHQTWKDLSVLHEIDACSGAAMIVRHSAMEQVGVLDEQFFMYAEDIDWCYRFKRKNWKIVYFPGVVVRHDKHTSGLKKTIHAGKTVHSVFIQHRSTVSFFDAMRLFYAKHYKQIYPTWVYWCVLFGISTLQFLKLTKKRVHL